MPILPVPPGAPPPSFVAAVAEFNAGDYFTCHETLEELWLDERSTFRRFYQGFLQVGVGCHHLRRGNAAGALSLLERGPQLLAPFAPAVWEFDVAALLAQARQLLDCLQDEGLEPAQASLARRPPQLVRHGH